MLNLLMISVAAYAATNVDNLTVLLTFLAASRGHTRVVMAGQIVGSLALIIFALGCAVLMLSLPRPWIGISGNLSPRHRAWPTIQALASR